MVCQAPLLHWWFEAFHTNALIHVMDLCGPGRLPLLLLVSHALIDRFSGIERSISCAALLKGWQDLSLLGRAAVVVDPGLVWIFVVYWRKGICETHYDTLVLTSSKCCLKDSVLSRCTLRWGLLEFQALVVNDHVWFCQCWATDATPGGRLPRCPSLGWDRLPWPSVIQ